MALLSVLARFFEYPFLCYKFHSKRCWIDKCIEIVPYFKLKQSVKQFKNVKILFPQLWWRYASLEQIWWNLRAYDWWRSHRSRWPYYISTGNILINISIADMSWYDDSIIILCQNLAFAPSRRTWNVHNSVSECAHRHFENYSDASWRRSL